MAIGGLKGQKAAHTTGHVALDQDHHAHEGCSGSAGQVVSADCRRASCCPKRIMYSQSTEEKAAHHRDLLHHRHLKLEDLRDMSAGIHHDLGAQCHTHGIGSRRQARSNAASMMV
jgi:hypothetical protein